MKQLLYSRKLSRGLIFATVMMAPLFGTMADNKGGGSPQPNIPIRLPLNPKPNISHRPKAPSMQNVTCTYNEGSLTFEFAYPEGQCQLILADPTTGETVAAGFDSAVSEPVYVGYHSTASLTVTTANGNTYTGMW